jgi:glycosyltransferase involved in cell wall biosynthesis
MSHDLPSVSVLMPVRNGGRFLRAAIASLLRQSLEDFELLVVDGGSTDATPRVLDRMARRDHRIRVLHRPGAGIVDALNAGLAFARAPLIARMDADDVALPPRLEVQADFLDRHPEFVGCGSAVSLIDRGGAEVDQWFRPHDPAVLDAAFMRGDSTAIIHSSLMVRRSALETVGGYRKFAQYAEDLDLYLRLGEIGELTNLPAPLLRYRIHFRSTQFERRTAKRVIKEDVLRDACRRRGVPFAPEVLDQRYLEKDPAELHRHWSASALGLGHRLTAVKHAFLATLRAPTDPATHATLRHLKDRLFRPLPHLSGATPRAAAPRSSAIPAGSGR